MRPPAAMTFSCCSLGTGSLMWSLCPQHLFSRNRAGIYGIGDQALTSESGRHAASWYLAVASALDPPFGMARATPRRGTGWVQSWPICADLTTMAGICELVTGE